MAADERAQELACAALEELFRARWTKNGPAAVAFLDYMAGRPARVSGAGGESAFADAEGLGRKTLATETAFDIRGRVAFLEEELTRLESALAAAKNNNRDLSDRLDAALTERDRALEAARAAEVKLAAQTRRTLRNQDELFALQEFLDSLPAAAREVLGTCFDVDDLTVFLAQCGQFGRLNQFWEVCGKAVAAGGAPGEMARVLEKLLALFNAAAGRNPAAIVAPSPGDPYRSDIHCRVASDGTTVRALLLPGLRNPGGKLQQPALVELK